MAEQVGGPLVGSTLKVKWKGKSVVAELTADSKRTEPGLYDRMTPNHNLPVSSATWGQWLPAGAMVALLVHDWLFFLTSEQFSTGSRSLIDLGLTCASFTLWLFLLACPFLAGSPTRFRVGLDTSQRTRVGVCKACHVLSLSPNVST
jgi:hypothetical protein